jgi:hypothetical protein
MMKQLVVATAAVGLVSVGAHDASAADAHATLGAWQSQTFNNNGVSADAVTLGQNMDLFTGTWLNDSAASNSHQKASQIETGVATTATQNQIGTADAHLWWEDNKWPASTKAWTGGGTAQDQVIWSAHPVDQQQTAQNWQESRIEDHTAIADGTIEQRQQGPTGDVQQHQETAGNTVTTGYSVPSFPSQFTFDFSGKLRQFIGLTVENILNF